MQIVMAAAVAGIIRRQPLWGVLSLILMDFMTWQVMFGNGQAAIMMAAVIIKLCGVGRGRLVRAMSAHLTVTTVRQTFATTISASVVPSNKLYFALLHF